MSFTPAHPLKIHGLLFASLAPALFAQSPDAGPVPRLSPEVLPGSGLRQHDFFYAGESKSRRMFIVRSGAIAWSYDDPAGKGEISDAILLSDGRVLLAHQFAVKLVAPDRRVIWSFDAPSGCEIHTAQMVGEHHVLFVQNGNPALVRVVDLRSGTVVHEFPLPTGHPDNVHGQFRHARLTPRGTLLVAHMDLAKIAEYDYDGREVWSTPSAHPWGADPIDDERILITEGQGVREVNRSGQTLWSFNRADAPGYVLKNFQLAWRLPNGNTLLNTWFNEWSDRLDRANPPVQAIEVTPDKRVVWALRSWSDPDLGPSTTLQLLDDPVSPPSPHFGPLR